MGRKNVGSDFDAFLGEDDFLEEATAVAIKRVVAHQIATLMQEQGLTRSRWHAGWRRVALHLIGSSILRIHQSLSRHYKMPRQLLVADFASALSLSTVPHESPNNALELTWRSVTFLAYARRAPLRHAAQLDR